MSGGELELELLELRTRVRRWRVTALILGALLFLVAFLAMVFVGIALSGGGGGLPLWPSTRRAMLEEQRARMAVEEARLAAEMARRQAEQDAAAQKSAAETAGTQAQEDRSDASTASGERDKPASDDATDRIDPAP